MPYRPGDYYVICDICGFKKYRSECRENYKGQIVCSATCYEPQHPQEYMKSVPEKIVVADPRPEPTDHFLEVGEVTQDDL